MFATFSYTYILSWWTTHPSSHLTLFALTLSSNLNLLMSELHLSLEVCNLIGIRKLHMSCSHWWGIFWNKSKQQIILPSSITIIYCNVEGGVFVIMSFHSAQEHTHIHTCILSTVSCCNELFSRAIMWEVCMEAAGILRSNDASRWTILYDTTSSEISGPTTMMFTAYYTSDSI